MANYFEFAGKRSTDFGLVVERYPKRPKPARRVNTYQIPGRSGLLRGDTGTYDNVLASYDCYFRGKDDEAAAIAQWLYTAPGYSRLSDTYSPGFFSYAAFDGPLDIENILNRFGRCTITFTCLPERYSEDGQEPLTFYPDPDVRTYSFTLVNPYQFTAKPLIRLTGQLATSVTINRRAFSVSSIPTYLDVDSDMQNVYKGSVSYNNLVTVPTEFPVLDPGENYIVVAGERIQSVSEITIWPRWWRL